MPLKFTEIRIAHVSVHVGKQCPCTYVSQLYSQLIKSRICTSSNPRASKNLRGRTAFLVGNVEASVDLAPVITAVPRAAVGKVTFVRILLANWGQRLYALDACVVAWNGWVVKTRVQMSEI